MNSESKRFFMLAVIFGTVSIFVCLGAYWSFLTTAESIGATFTNSNSKRFVVINGASIQVTIAANEAARERGLGGRSQLPVDTGMLFTFDKDNSGGIWMKDMKFPIDVVWVTSDKTIVHIVENMTPESYPKIFLPPQKIRYILEVPAGTVKRHTIKIGNTLSIQ